MGLVYWLRVFLFYVIGWNVVCREEDDVVWFDFLGLVKMEEMLEFLGSVK